MLFFINERNDAAYNLALEEIMTGSVSGDAFLLWRNSPAVIVGRNQNTHGEVNLDFVRANSIQVVRRMSGGGAVYHDLGNVNFSCITDAEEHSFASFESFAHPILQVLRDFGVPACFSGRNDILVDGRKVSGTAKCFTGGRVLFHGTLLFDADLSMLSRVLTPSKGKVISKGIQSVRSRVANLREWLPQWDSNQFFMELAMAMTHQLEISGTSEIPDEFCRRAESLAASKYAAWEWNYGASPAYDFVKNGRFPGGCLSLGMNIRQGIIQKAGFSGDFFGAKPISELAEALEGVPHRRDAILMALNKFHLEEYLLGISEQDFLELFE